MNRVSRFGRRRGFVERSAQRIASVAAVMLLIVMALGAAVLGGAPAGVGAQTATPVTASVVPATTLLYVAVDLDTKSAQYQKATELLQRLGVDTSVQDLAGEMSSAVTGGNATAATQFDALLGGQAGIAVFDFGVDLSSLSGAIEGDLGMTGLGTPAAGAGGATSTTSVAIVISAPDPDAAYSAAESALQQDATNQGTTVSQETYEGVQIETLAGDETSGTSGSSLARVGDFVVFGTAAADVYPVIDTESGKTPSLADSADFAKIAAALNPDWLLFGHVNGTEVAHQLDAAAASGIDVSSINLAQLKADSGFVVWADDPGFRFDSITVPAADGSTDVPANFEPDLPSRVPGDSLLLVDGADLGKTGFLDTVILAALGSLTGSVGSDVATPEPSKSPEEIAQEQFAQLEAILGFNVKTDFIDQLVGEWGIAAWGIDANAMSGQDYSGIHFLLISDAQTPATVSDAVSKLSLLLQAGLAGQGTVTTKLIGQDQINVLTIDTGSGEAPVTIEYGVVNGKFILSLNDAISEYLAGGSSLADNPNYKDALAALPSEHNGVFYLDLTQIVPIVQSAISATTSSFATTDASEKCAAYSTQAAAQEAFDADPATNWELDQDFDGQACEDYFAASSPTPEVSPAANQLAALKSLTAVAFERDGMSGTSALLMIAQ
jgi:hypothetical protein